MRNIKPFPELCPSERDELRKKIVHGVVTESYVASPTVHRLKALEEDAAWVTYPCWLSGSQWEDGKGFKKFKYKGHTLYIHRASCELFNGPVLSTHLVDHLCRVRGCCQPAHLEAVTPAENILRGANQNHMMRKGAHPPCAKDINPAFFTVPDAGTVDDEYRRREREGRNGPPRYWEADCGPPPAPSEGFFWEPVSGFGTISHVLQPIRTAAEQDWARHQDSGAAQRQMALTQAMLTDLPAPQPELEVPGPTREVNPDWVEGKSGATIFRRVPDEQPLKPGEMLIRFGTDPRDQWSLGPCSFALVGEGGGSPIEDMCAQHHTAYEDQGRIVAAMAPIGPEDPFNGPSGVRMEKKPSLWRRFKAWLDAPIWS